MSHLLEKEFKNIAQWKNLKISGKVTHIIGLLIESLGPKASLGEICYINDRHNNRHLCEVVGFKQDKVLLMSLGDMTAISPGAEVFPTGHVHRVGVSKDLCGRVLGALGEPIDKKGPIHYETFYSVNAPPPDPLSRQRISEPLETGIKVIDATCTTGKGQRIGIFSGSGVGKSTLLGMIAKMSEADINVIALIGERGREVNEFIERELGSEGLKKSVVVVATSDQAGLLRAKGAAVATSIAEYFRDQGLSVMFMMDSITRYAMALREIGLAVGEPPTTKGYTPSVFSSLPKVLERSGNSSTGSITGIYTILMEGDDLNDPIVDTVRSILDGHIILSRKLAAANYFPSVDVLNSLSRVMNEIVSPEHRAAAGKLREILQAYYESEDLINIGAYVRGSNPKVDNALEKIGPIIEFLKQSVDEKGTLDESFKQLEELVN